VIPARPRGALAILGLAAACAAAVPATLSAAVPPAVQGEVLPVPALLAGEGLAVAGPGGILRTWGEAGREAPMGSLAKLVWLAREGPAWEGRGASFHCTGRWEGWTCWRPRGHGTVDLAGALRASCNLAFLAWARESLEMRRARQGESATRAGLEGDFAPFLGNRLPPSEALPPLAPPWVGDGGLLRTRADGFATWLADPARAPLRAQCARLLADRGGWWVKTGTGPGAPEETCAWAAGSDGTRTAVLRLPRGRGKAEGLARFRALVEGTP
jgi:hypothetical protein